MSCSVQKMVQEGILGPKGLLISSVVGGKHLTYNGHTSMVFNGPITWRVSARLADVSPMW